MDYPLKVGVGMRCRATYNYFPDGSVTDELAFPKNAEIREVENKNGDWYVGSIRWGGQSLPQQSRCDLMIPKTRRIRFYAL